MATIPPRGSAPMESPISGSAAKAGWTSRSMSRSWRRTVPRWTLSIRQPWRPAGATTARPEFARTTTRTITAHSCSIPTATTSKPSATRQPSSVFKRSGARFASGKRVKQKACRFHFWVAREPDGFVAVVAPRVDTSGDAMPIDPPEIPPATPGQPTEPPPENPPGNPRPEVPPPLREPGQPPQPQELPGKTPDELPPRGPNGPRTPNPATDQGSA